MWYKFSKNIIIAGKKEVMSILGNDLEKLQQIENIAPKFQMGAAYFLINGINIKQIKDYFEKLHLIEKYRPVDIQYTKKGILLNKELYPADKWLSLTEKIDALISAISESRKTKEQKEKEKAIQKQSEEILPIKDGEINVIKINNVNDAIKYGAGMSWCISQPGNTMWQSYRDTKDSSFYFIFDGTRPEGDPLRRVALDVTKNGILLTDIKNTTGVISEYGKDINKYLKYLQSKGVDTAQFINNPRTPEEIEEGKILGRSINSLKQFIQLPKDYPNISNIYSKYIGRGWPLSGEQLKWLISNKLNHLVNQYINTAGDHVELQKKYFEKNLQLKNTFDRMINIKADTLLKQIEDEGMDIESLGGEDCVKKLVEKGLNPLEVVRFYTSTYESGDDYGTMYRNERKMDPLTENVELLKYLIDHGAGNSETLDALPYIEANNVDLLKKIWHNSKDDKNSVGAKILKILPIDDPLIKEIIQNTKFSLENLFFHKKELYSNSDLLKFILERAIETKDHRALNAAITTYPSMTLDYKGKQFTIKDWIDNRLNEFNAKYNHKVEKEKEKKEDIEEKL
jgi:hypothetical protein